MMMTRKLRNPRGGAYVEYFLAAAAFAVAALWFYDGGSYHGVQAQLQGGHNARMNQIGGTVTIP